MGQKIRHSLFYCLGGFFLLFDQLLKYFARTSPLQTHYLLRPWIGWEFLANQGIAFGIPLPSWLVIGATPLVLLALLIAFIRARKNNFVLAASLMAIILGAVSNYIDRARFDYTVDYLRVFTSVLNLGDIMIAGGVAGILLQTRKK